MVLDEDRYDTARQSRAFAKPASSRLARFQESPAFWRNPVVGGRVLAEQPAEKSRTQLPVVDQAVAAEAGKRVPNLCQRPPRGRLDFLPAQPADRLRCVPPINEKPSLRMAARDDFEYRDVALIDLVGVVHLILPR